MALNAKRGDNGPSFFEKLRAVDGTGLQERHCNFELVLKGRNRRVGLNLTPNQLFSLCSTVDEDEIQHGDQFTLKLASVATHLTGG